MKLNYKYRINKPNYEANKQKSTLNNTLFGGLIRMIRFDGPTETWTRIAGFEVEVRSANRYTIEPLSISVFVIVNINCPLYIDK